MSIQPRDAKVFTVLLISMTAGAIVLMALGNNPPSAGAFCLSGYYRLEPVEKAVFSSDAQCPSRWNHIEVYYSGTRTGNIEQLASLNGLADTEDIDCHFCIYNGHGGQDGQIQSTEKWQRQWSVMPDTSAPGGGQTIRICIIADGQTAAPTDYQIKRAEALIEHLCRKFNILPQAIHYPLQWQ